MDKSIPDGVHQGDENDEISSRSLIFLFLVVAYGFAAHRLRPSIRQLGPAWTEITSYAVGSLMIASVFPTIHSMTIDATNGNSITRRRAVFTGFLALLISIGAIGTGVAVAWLVDPDPYEGEG